MKKAKTKAAKARRIVRKVTAVRKALRHVKPKARTARRAPARKKAARQVRNAKPDALSKKLWLAKPQEKDPSLEEDWHSDLDDEMDFEETSGVSEE
ncbi:MAG: hypothetical protein WC792_01595 [Candidatus Micrarchaeia archaeon]|jgi:hypothetical protein